MLLHWFVHTSRPVRRVRRVCLDWLSPVVSRQVTVTVGSQRMVTPWNPGTRVASGDPFGCRVPSVLSPGGSPEPTIRAANIGRLTRQAVCVHCPIMLHPPSAQRIIGNGCVLWARSLATTSAQLVHVPAWSPAAGYPCAYPMFSSVNLLSSSLRGSIPP